MSTPASAGSQWEVSNGLPAVPLQKDKSFNEARPNPLDMWIMYVSMYTAKHTKKCTNFQVKYILSVPVRVLCNYVKRHHPCYDERLTLFCDQGAAQSLEQRYKRTFAVHVRSCSVFDR